MTRNVGESPTNYAQRLRRFQKRVTGIVVTPEDRRAWRIGDENLARLEAIDDNGQLATIDTLLDNVEPAKILAMRESERVLVAAGIPLTASQTGSSTVQPFVGDEVPASERHQSPRPGATSCVKPPGAIATAVSLHQAMKQYQEYLEREFHRPETNQISPWGKTQVKQVDTLIQHHGDRSIGELDASEINELIGYWRRRPCKLRTTTPMTAKSCKNYLSALTRFLKWLDTSSRFDWTKPIAFGDMDTRIRRLAVDHARKSLEQVDTFSLDELKLLMRYGQPFDRLLLLLGLNCGFGRAEIASILVGEVHLFSAHSPRHQEILDFKSTAEDSFIKRVRRKSGVYGEHILFPLTVKGIQWAMKRRKAFPGYGDHAVLVVNKAGTALDQPTKAGNANQMIPNHFDRLIKRIQVDSHDIRPLSFGKLRKTGSQLIKRFSDGEIMGVFDCHGQPVKSDALTDAYSNRPFGRVFTAIRDVQEYLQPVFKEAGETPFISRS
ncbi:hypothetical protein RMSM_03506 [Rhodopirellula maiorica SM1]|uniref:Core-binding (CB) domain-containing protein n=1 Tax=Rhodopirellula maiorica SM1 TaxID=1265738 RepID=M5RJT1_9BACT|nr:hypothetical protein RMSM_03506 [Rhodopirellula maiorica SM1]